MTGSLLSVNVSEIRSREHDGETVSTGIFKTPVSGRVPVRGVNVQGDDQADRANHGGEYRAGYAYAREDYRWWEERLGRDIAAGAFGENLTTQGIDVNGALIGERWRAGTVEFEVTCPRVPCYKLAMTMGDPGFVRTFAQAARPGAYLKIVTEGDIAPGDDVSIVSKPEHTLTLEMMVSDLHVRTQTAPRTSRSRTSADMAHVGSRSVGGTITYRRRTARKLRAGALAVDDDSIRGVQQSEGAAEMDRVCEAWAANGCERERIRDAGGCDAPEHRAKHRRMTGHCRYRGSETDIARARCTNERERRRVVRRETEDRRRKRGAITAPVPIAPKIPAIASGNPFFMNAGKTPSSEKLIPLRSRRRCAFAPASMRAAMPW